MKMYNCTEDFNIEQARLVVMKHFKDAGFLDRIIAVDKFNHTNDMGIIVAHKIAEFKGGIYLRHYKPWYRFSKAVAYAEKPNIYFNAYKNMPWIDRVETLAHEICHMMGYSHKGNYVNKYNDLTVPYLVSKIFKDYVKEIYVKPIRGES